MVVWREGEKVSDSAFPSDLIHCRADLSATNLQLIPFIITIQCVLPWVAILRKLKVEGRLYNPKKMLSIK